MEVGTGDPAPGLFTNNSVAPLHQGLGLRQMYQWGFYGMHTQHCAGRVFLYLEPIIDHCAYVDVSKGQGICSNHTFGAKFIPLDVLLGDTPDNYTVFTQFIIPASTFKNSSYLGSFSTAAFWLVFVGTLAAGVSLITFVDPCEI